MRPLLPFRAKNEPTGSRKSRVKTRVNAHSCLPFYNSLPCASILSHFSLTHSLASLTSSPAPAHSVTHTFLARVHTLLAHLVHRAVAAVGFVLLLERHWLAYQWLLLRLWLLDRHSTSRHHIRQVLVVVVGILSAGRQTFAWHIGLSERVALDWRMSMTHDIFNCLCGRLLVS